MLFNSNFERVMFKHSPISRMQREHYSWRGQREQSTEVKNINYTDNTMNHLKLQVNYLVLFSGSAYAELYNKCSVALDQHLNNDVARQLLEDQPINTKSDLILESAQEGIVSILKKWPDMKSKLHIHLNQPLPGNLRQLAWRLYLDNPKGEGVMGAEEII